MTECKQADEQRNVANPAQKKDNADEKQEVIESGHHVLGTEPNKQRELQARPSRNQLDVLARHVVRERRTSKQQQDDDRSEFHLE